MLVFTVNITSNSIIYYKYCMQKYINYSRVKFVKS